MKVYEIIAKEMEKKPEERSFHFKQIERWLKKLGFTIIPISKDSYKVHFALNKHHHLGERVLEVIISEKEVDMLGDCELLFYMQMEMHDLFLEWNKFMQTKWGGEVQEMTKDDLKTGMVVETRDGSKYMVIRGEFNTTNYGEQSLMFISPDGFNHNDVYADDLIHTKYKDFDVVKIYAPPMRGFKDTLNDERNLIWERKSTREVYLEQEIEHLKAKLKEAEVELEKERGK